MDAPGPVVTDDPSRWLRSVAVLARQFDAKLTDPAVVEVGDDAVWFKCGEADIILRGEGNAPGSLPYNHRDGSPMQLANRLMWSSRAVVV